MMDSFQRHEQNDEGTSEPVTGPHLTLSYKDKTILEDAANLLIHHVKRQTGIQKQEKTKIKHILRQFVPDIFFAPRQQLSDDERDDDDKEMDVDNSDGEVKPKSNTTSSGSGGNIGGASGSGSTSEILSGSGSTTVPSSSNTDSIPTSSSNNNNNNNNANIKITDSDNKDNVLNPQISDDNIIKSECDVRTPNDSGQATCNLSSSSTIPTSSTTATVAATSNLIKSNNNDISSDDNASSVGIVVKTEAEIKIEEDSDMNAATNALSSVPIHAVSKYAVRFFS